MLNVFLIKPRHVLQVFSSQKEFFGEALQNVSGLNNEKKNLACLICAQETKNTIIKYTCQRFRYFMFNLIQKNSSGFTQQIMMNILIINIIYILLSIEIVRSKIYLASGGTSAKGTGGSMHAGHSTHGSMRTSKWINTGASQEDSL